MNDFHLKWCQFVISHPTSNSYHKTTGGKPVYINAHPIHVGSDDHFLSFVYKKEWKKSIPIFDFFSLTNRLNPKDI